MHAHLQHPEVFSNLWLRRELINEHLWYRSTGQEKNKGKSLSELRERERRSSLRFPILDAGRGVFALLVMVYHYDGEWRLRPTLQSAYLSVDLFFLMSGFVLSHAYQEDLDRGRMSFLTFCKVRTLRLYPVYAMGSLIGLGYYAFKLIAKMPDAASLKSLLLLAGLAAAFIPNPELVANPAGIFPLAPSSWSLSTEMIVSLLYATVAARMRNTAVYSFILISALPFLYKAYFLGSFDLGWGFDTFGYGVLRTISAFFLGALVYRRSRNRHDRHSTSALALLAVCTLSLIFFPPNFVVSFALVYIIFPAFLARQPKREINKHARGICEQMGRFSYPVYVLHTPVALWVDGAAKAAGYNSVAIGRPFGVILVIATLFVSWIVLQVDESLRRTLSRRLNRRVPLDPPRLRRCPAQRSLHDAEV